MTPLFKVSKIHSNLLMRPVFRALKISSMDIMTPEKSRLSPDLLYFGNADFDIGED